MTVREQIQKQQEINGIWQAAKVAAWTAAVVVICVAPAVVWAGWRLFL